MRHGPAPDAASKIYYALFHAAQALLKSEGIDVTKHSAVESTFGYYFVKTGKITVKVINHYGDEVLKVYEVK
jgi:uncharacterized protein (UPF0332 family)